MMRGDVALRVREIVREICRDCDTEIMRGYVAKDHVHLFVSIPPQVTISRLVQKLKGKSSYKLLDEFPHLRKTYWGRHVWARGYFCVSSGNVTDEIIKGYIERQGTEEDVEFKVEGEEEPKGPTRTPRLQPQ